MTVLATTKIEVRLPNKHKEMVQTIAALIEQVRQEPGCVSSEIYCQVDNQNALCLLEQWATEADLDAHLMSENLSILRGAAQALHADLEMKFYTPSERP